MENPLARREGHDPHALYAPGTLHVDDARYAQVPMRLALFSSFRFASSALHRRVRYLGGRLCLCGVASSRMLWAVPFFRRKSRKRCRRVAVVLLPPFRRLRTGCRSRQRFRFRLSAARSGSLSVTRSLLHDLYTPGHHVSHPVRPLVPIVSSRVNLSSIYVCLQNGQPSAGSKICRV